MKLYIISFLVNHTDRDIFENPNFVANLPFFCDFGESFEERHWCNFEQYKYDDAEWNLANGETPDPLTGPRSHAAEQHGEEDDMG